MASSVNLHLSLRQRTAVDRLRTFSRSCRYHWGSSRRPGGFVRLLTFGDGCLCTGRAGDMGPRLLNIPRRDTTTHSFRPFKSLLLLLLLLLLPLSEERSPEILRERRSALRAFGPMALKRSRRSPCLSPKGMREKCSASPQNRQERLHGFLLPPCSPFDSRNGCSSSFPPILRSRSPVRRANS